MKNVLGGNETNLFETKVTAYSEWERGKNMRGVGNNGYRKL